MILWVVLAQCIKTRAIHSIMQGSKTLNSFFWSFHHCFCILKDAEIWKQAIVWWCRVGMYTQEQKKSVKIIFILIFPNSWLTLQYQSCSRFSVSVERQTRLSYLGRMALLFLAAFISCVWTSHSMTSYVQQIRHAIFLVIIMALLTEDEKIPVIKVIYRMTDILPLTALEQASCCWDYN